MSRTNADSMGLWNYSRKLASTAVDIIEDEENDGVAPFARLLTEFEHVPFDEHEELDVLVTALKDSTDNHADVVDVIHRYVYERLSRRADEEGLTHPEFENWNEAISAASDVVTWYDEGHSEQAYATRRVEHRPLPLDADTAATLVDIDVQFGSNMDRMNAVARALREYAQSTNVDAARRAAIYKTADLDEAIEAEPVAPLNGPDAEDGISVESSPEPSGSDTTQEETEEDVNPSGPVEEIAHALYGYFVDREYNTYRDVESEFDVEFPARDVSMMAVMNKRNGDVKASVEKIANWVSEWYGDESEVAELDRDRPVPMGYRPGAD